MGTAAASTEEVRMRPESTHRDVKDEKHEGKIVQIISAIVDVKFDSKAHLPSILNALECYNDGNKVVLEVAQHTGDGGIDFTQFLKFLKTVQVSFFSL